VRSPRKLPRKLIIIAGGDSAKKTLLDLMRRNAARMREGAQLRIDNLMMMKL
jgi:hypothetical protein